MLLGTSPKSFFKLNTQVVNFSGAFSPKITKWLKVIFGLVSFMFTFFRAGGQMNIYDFFVRIYNFSNQWGKILPTVSSFIAQSMISFWKYFFAEGRYFITDNVLDEVTFGWPRQKSDIHLKEHLALRLQRAINWVFLIFSQQQLDYILLSYLLLLLLHLLFLAMDGLLISYYFLSMTVGGIKWHTLGQRSSLSKWWIQASSCLGNPIGKSK